MSFAIAILAGLLAGILTGAGIGGGTLLILWMTEIIGIDPPIAQGINIVYFLACAPPALISHITHGRVEIKGGAIAGAFGCASAALVAWLSADLNSDVFRRIFAVLFIIVGIKELFSKAQKR